MSGAKVLRIRDNAGDATEHVQSKPRPPYEFTSCMAFQRSPRMASITSFNEWAGPRSIALFHANAGNR